MGRWELRNENLGGLYLVILVFFPCDHCGEIPNHKAHKVFHKGHN